MSVDNLEAALIGLTESQVLWLKDIIRQFSLPHDFRRNPGSDLITEAVLANMGDTLRIHHAFSRQPLSKDRFEYALERALIMSGYKVAWPQSRTNRGHDLTVNDIRVNLKTEASAGIKADYLHISKFMELGRGPWELPALLDLFLQHMTNYERIFQMRCLDHEPGSYQYELVEIPKNLLQDARGAKLEIQDGSTQNPKPGYGRVYDEHGQQKFALYFDAGSERKLQIKHIRKTLCVVHATWRFDTIPLESASTQEPLGR